MANSVVRDFAVNRRVYDIIVREDKRPTAIADKAGIRRDTFSRVIRCKRPLYADEVIPVCRALGVPVSALFPDAEDDI